MQAAGGCLLAANAVAAALAIGAGPAGVSVTCICAASDMLAGDYPALQVFVPWDRVASTEMNLPVSQMDCWIPG